MSAFSQGLWGIRKFKAQEDVWVWDPQDRLLGHDSVEPGVGDVVEVSESILWLLNFTLLSPCVHHRLNAPRMWYHNLIFQIDTKYYYFHLKKK